MNEAKRYQMRKKGPQRFAQEQHEAVKALAKEQNLRVPKEVEQLFAAINGDRYEDATNIFQKLVMARQASPGPIENFIANHEGLTSKIGILRSRPFCAHQSTVACLSSA